MQQTVNAIRSAFRGSFIKKICNYLHDCVREEVKSSTFRNLKGDKENKWSFLDGEEKVFTSDQTLGIELATRAVGNAKDVKEVNDLDAIKINTDENNNIKVPTEIFIEEPKEEPLDLFTVTDPFLDDNYLDTGEKTKPVNSIPKIENIGTVKPNSTFAKIEEVVKENDDIILPTLGLSEQEKVNVPIVSGNYIN